MTSPVGQVGLPDGSTDLNFISKVCSILIQRLDTMKLVKVMAVNPGDGTPPIAGTVDVQLLVSQINANGTPQANGVVSGLPYFRLGGAVWQIINDPAVGDIGYVACLDRDSTLALANKAIAQPGSFRQYNVSDGIYVGGLANGAPKAWAWFKSDGTFVISDQNQNGVQSTSSALNLLIGGTTIMALTSSGGQLTGDLAVSGDITDSSGSISLTNHTHPVPGVQTGSGEVETGPPTG